MLPSFILSLREGIEAALIVGIVFGATRQMYRTDLKPTVWLGVACATILSLLVAVLLTFLGLNVAGDAEKIFEGITLLLAASILTWMVFWMNRQARFVKGELENGVQKATLENGKRGLFIVSFLAVLREGIELALFLVAAVFASDIQQTLIGALLGLGTAILLGWMLFTTTVRLDLRRFFQVTGILLILFAAGLVAHAVHEFNEAGWFPAIIEHVWDVNSLLDEKSTGGAMLVALFGYNGNPSLSEVLAYLAYFTLTFSGLRFSERRAPAAQKLA
jgi:high-affinity iron transporter